MRQPRGACVAEWKSRLFTFGNSDKSSSTSLGKQLSRIRPSENPKPYGVWGFAYKGNLQKLGSYLLLSVVSNFKIQTQKGSNERLFILTRTHSTHIFGEIPFVKPQNDT